MRIPVPASVARMPRFAFDVARGLGMSRDRRRCAPAASSRTSSRWAPTRSTRGTAARIEDFLAPFVDHAPTIGIFGFLLGLYFILPYWEVSAGEAIWSFQRMARDNFLSYPKGGLDRDPVGVRAPRRPSAARRCAPEWA